MTSRARRTEVTSEVVFLGKLLQRVASGRIRVPKFQRAFVWRQSDVHSLLDSVYRGFPIGSILVWDTDATIQSAGRIGPVSVPPAPDGTVGYLLDGQQRLSALVGTLRPDSQSEGPAIADGLDWSVYFDLESREFVRKPGDGLKPQHFPVRRLLNTAAFFAECRRIERDAPASVKARQWIDEADRLANAFRDYQLPLIRIQEADLDGAVAVFARLNRTGRKMAADEMVSALTYEEDGFHLASALSEFKVELEPLGFGNLKRVFLLRTVLAALELDIYAKDWANLIVQQDVRRQLPSGFGMATRALHRALDFLRGLGVTSDRLLPYGLQLVLLAEFFRKRPDPTEAMRRVLRRWFWVTSFCGWFGGVSTARVKLALDEMRELAEGTRGDCRVVDLNSPAAVFPDRFDGRSARVRAFLLYLASLRPRSLCGDGTLDPGYLMRLRRTEAVGYVVANPGRGEPLLSSPANRMFVDEGHVGQTLRVLKEMNDAQRERVLHTHGFGATAVDALRRDDWTELIRARRDTLAAGELKFMEREDVHRPTERAAAVIADSEASDDE